MLQRQPTLLRIALGRDIPSDVLILLKAVAGQREALERITKDHEASASEILAVTKLYLQGILTSAVNNDRRMLCLPADAKIEDIQEHKKWLLKWLHPDRNHNSWESALFVKVNSAAARLLLDKNFGPDFNHQLPSHSRNKQAKFRRKSDMAPYRSPRPAGMLRRVTKPFLIMATTLAVLITVLNSASTPVRPDSQNTVSVFNIFKLFK